MDLAHRFSRVRNFVRLPKGVRSLPKFAELRLTPVWRRRLTGTLLLVSSLALGAWAYDEASKDAVVSWERRHPPTFAIWQHALGSRDFRRAPNDSKAGQASRSLP